MSISKNYLFGVIIGILFVSLIGLDFYQRTFQSETISLPLDPSPMGVVVSSDTLSPSSLSPIPPSSIPIKSLSPTPKPTFKPTPTIAMVSPTPTPKPKPDYYLQSTSQTLLPDNIQGVTEYLETQTYPRIRIEAIFAANNVQVGDLVTRRIYEDGVLQEVKEQTIFSTSDFHFAEVYYPKARSVGTHTVKITYNDSRSIEESNFNNNEANFSFKIIPENVPPTFTIRGPEVINNQYCLTWENLQDNVSVYTDVWAKWKIDEGSWSGRSTGTTWGCISASLGSTHTYSVHAEDFRGNIKEETKTFTIY